MEALMAHNSENHSMWQITPNFATFQNIFSMNKVFFALSLVFISWSCRQEPTAEQAAAVAAAQTISTNPVDPAAATTAVRPESIDQLDDSKPASGQTATTTSRSINMMASQVSATSGSVACVDISVKGFEQIIGMQYSLHWDHELLSFREVKGFQLKNLDAADFGTRLANQGVLTSAWIEDSLKGVTLAAGSVIYQVCFDVKGTAGKYSPIRFHNQPTPYEVIDRAENILGFVGVDGKVTIQ